MPTLLWLLLVVVYITCFVILGLATFRKGHYFLFWVGIIFPLLWIIGALMAPTPAAIERERGAAAAGTR
jgi:hypothetical protein